MRRANDRQAEMVASGATTNTHVAVASVRLDFFGATFGRPLDESRPWIPSRGQSSPNDPRTISPAGS